MRAWLSCRDCGVGFEGTCDPDGYPDEPYCPRCAGRLRASSLERAMADQERSFS